MSEPETYRVIYNNQRYNLDFMSRDQGVLQFNEAVEKIKKFAPFAVIKRRLDNLDVGATNTDIYGCNILMYILRYELYHNSRTVYGNSMKSNPVSCEDLRSLIKFLVTAKGLDVNKKNAMGLNALNYAINYGHNQDVINTLMDLGAKSDESQIAEKIEKVV